MTSKKPYVKPVLEKLQKLSDVMQGGAPAATGVVLG
jgi:hypothetical protein